MHSYHTYHKNHKLMALCLASALTSFQQSAHSNVQADIPSDTIPLVVHSKDTIDERTKMHTAVAQPQIDEEVSQKISIGLRLGASVRGKAGGVLSCIVVLLYSIKHTNKFDPMLLIGSGIVGGLIGGALGTVFGAIQGWWHLRALLHK